MSGALNVERLSLNTKPRRLSRLQHAILTEIQVAGAMLRVYIGRSGKDRRDGSLARLQLVPLCYGGAGMIPLHESSYYRAMAGLVSKGLVTRSRYKRFLKTSDGIRCGGSWVNEYRLTMAAAEMMTERGLFYPNRARGGWEQFFDPLAMAGHSADRMIAAGDSKLTNVVSSFERSYAEVAS